MKFPSGVMLVSSRFAPRASSGASSSNRSLGSNRRRHPCAPERSSHVSRNTSMLDSFSLNRSNADTFLCFSLHFSRITLLGTRFAFGNIRARALPYTAGTASIFKLGRAFGQLIVTSDTFFWRDVFEHRKCNGVCRMDVLSDTNADEIHRGHKRRCRGNELGKVMVARFTESEWQRRSEVGGQSMLAERGWTKDNLLVLDLQTGEGAVFKPGGYAKGEPDKHAVWVCPLFEPFLGWLYAQDWADIEKLPALVKIKSPVSALYGYRRPGPGATEETGGAGEARQEKEREGRGKGYFFCSILANIWGLDFLEPDAGHRPR